MKPLVLIPARGGSKGIPGKNIKPLGGKPLIYYTIEVARQIFTDEQICVSTDDIGIKKKVEEIGLKVPFLRPNELAADDSGSYEVMLHAVNFYEQNGYYPDTLILLQPTSPFRKAKHIIEAISLFTDIDMVVSVKETKANPYYVLFEENENGFLKKSKRANISRRQDCPKVWEINGAVYVISIEKLKENPINNFEKVVKMVMSEEDSIDLDTPLEWDFAEFIIKKREDV